MFRRNLLPSSSGQNSKPGGKHKVSDVGMREPNVSRRGNRFLQNADRHTERLEPTSGDKFSACPSWKKILAAPMHTNNVRRFFYLIKIKRGHAVA
jgi:hypothetical protein